MMETEYFQRQTFKRILELVSPDIIAINGMHPTDRARREGQISERIRIRNAIVKYAADLGVKV